MDGLEDLPDGGSSGVLVGDVLLLRQREGTEEVTGDGVVILLPRGLEEEATGVVDEHRRVGNARRGLNVSDAVLASHPCTGVGLPMTIVVLVQFDETGATRLG
jgi:hypothetical protein